MVCSINMYTPAYFSFNVPHLADLTPTQAVSCSHCCVEVKGHDLKGCVQGSVLRTKQMPLLVPNHFLFVSVLSHALWFMCSSE